MGLSDPYIQDSAVAAADSLVQLQSEEAKIKHRVTALKSEYAHHRFHTYKARRNFLKRIHDQEMILSAVMKELTSLKNNPTFALYTKIQNKAKGGLNVHVEISIDGHSFSNPAPTIANNARIWVRTKVDDAHRGSTGTPETHELCHLTWSYDKRFIKQDNIGTSGRDEYFVSYPLIITREFIAPSTGSTKSNWLVYVDAYEKINPSIV